MNLTQTQERAVCTEQVSGDEEVDDGVQPYKYTFFLISNKSIEKNVLTKQRVCFYMF